MLRYPHFDPIALDLGLVQIRWYGLMYLAGFAAAWILGRYRARKPYSPIMPQQVDDLIWYLVLGLMIGARVGYILFYDFPSVYQDPLIVFKVWRGGMSFHGGLIGVIVSVLLFAKNKNINCFDIGDFICPLAPIGLMCGRFGNFINGELWGRPTDLPWGMIFPDIEAGLVPRHPSQLYEAALEGVTLFCILWFYSAKPRPRMAVSGMFLFFYGLFRFSVEFTRQPDSQLGFIAFDWLTMGQLLSVPMILAGGGLLFRAYTRRSR
ncbi:MAG: prolipoprotein diacylglyceryl transferase [Desulfovibrio sp.]|uniref:prolipoprotein diacylglyceryl transferase n=1 Tax=Desulfovibrio sp. 7SRBS1 TaxID=3378064 RepID=UPI003B3EEAEE